MKEILSFGGGTQTIAMCILVARGILPKPDAVIAADTGREMPSTWEYADRYARPLLASVGLDLHIAGHELATVDIYGKNGDLIIPAYTTTSRLTAFCSGEWKERVVFRYASNLLGASWRTQRHWLGISLDERKRAKKNPQCPKWYPLIERGLTRADCQHIIEAAGLPIPPKSRCYMCPHQDNAEWREVRERPELWAQAVALDEILRDSDERETLFLHKSREPLEVADIEQDEPRGASRQCGLGMCFV